MNGCVLWFVVEWWNSETDMWSLENSYRFSSRWWWVSGMKYQIKIVIRGSRYKVANVNRNNIRLCVPWHTVFLIYLFVYFLFMYTISSRKNARIFKIKTGLYNKLNVDCTCRRFRKYSFPEKLQGKSGHKTA